MSGFTKAIKKFPGTFWTANTMEIMERWSWYGLFAVLALYLTNSTDEGALGFSQIQKGNIMGTVTSLLYLLPIITGTIADRFGYKKILLLAYAILTTGYFMMGKCTTYGAVYFSFIYVALGAALFKPVITATVSKTTDDETSSIGFGIFYMMVNIGAFIGPFAAKLLRTNDNLGWDWVFYMCAVIISINFILLLLFYKDPSLEDNQKENVFNPKDYIEILFVFITSTLIFLSGFLIFLAIFLLETPIALLNRSYNRTCFKFSGWILSLPIGESNKKIFNNITTIFRDPHFIIFLLIIVGFWTMFNQLFYTLPNFIDQWGKTASIYNFLGSISPKLASWIGTEEGIIPPEMMINIDAGLIIIFQVVVSTIVMRMKPLNAMISGIIVCSLGTGLAFMTSNGLFIIIGILIFAFGEMASSIKVTEYIGKIAPKDKTALYMGCSFLPMAGGNYLTKYLSGPVYQAMSDKITLLKTEVAARSLSIPEISKTFTQNDYIARAAELMNMTHAQLTQMLWDKYNPSRIWIIFTAIGLCTAFFLFLYDRLLLSKKIVEKPDESETK